MKASVTMKRIGESWRQATMAGTLDLVRKRTLAQELKAAVGPAPARSYLVNILGENPGIVHALLTDTLQATNTSSERTAAVSPSRTERQRIADQEIDTAIAARRKHATITRQAVDEEMNLIFAEKSDFRSKAKPLIEKWSKSTDPFERLCACVLRLDGRFDPAKVTDEDLAAAAAYGKATITQFFAVMTEQRRPGQLSRIMELVMNQEVVRHA